MLSWVAHSVITPTTPKERSVIIKKLLKLIVVKSLPGLICTHVLSLFSIWKNWGTIMELWL